MKKLIVSLASVALIVAGFQGTILARPLPVLRAGVGDQVPDAAIRDLRAIGITLSDAVVKGDIDVLVKHDRPDLRLRDQTDLHDAHSELYCFVFERSCNLERRASVRDVITRAKRLDVRVQTLNAIGNAPHALLLFFDAQNVDRLRLGSAEYLCSLSKRGRLASWLFKWQDGQWTSAHPLFDFGTDTLCSSP